MENNIVVHYDYMKDLYNKYVERGVNRTEFVNYGKEKYKNTLTVENLCLIWQAFDMVMDNLAGESL